MVDEEEIKSKIKHVQVYPDTHGQFRWRAMAGNWEIIAVSGESYVREQHAIEMAQTFAPAGVIVERVDE